MSRQIFKYIFVILLFGQLNFLIAQSSLSYSELIVSADSYFAKKDYYNAKTTYQLALKLDANAEHPKKRIEEIIRTLNDELELRILFEEKMQNAENAYAIKDYEKAIIFYKEAAAIITYEAKPKQEISRIEKEWEAVKSKQSAYDRLFNEARNAKQSQDFVSAIAKLEEAGKLFPSKSEVLTEIAQIKLLLKQQNSKREEFNILVTEADKRLAQNRFQEALKDYQAAAALFNDDSHVKAQLILVNSAIKVEEAYNKTIEKADAFYIALELDQARRAYEEALKIWPEKTYPGSMLAKLDEAKQRRTYDLELINKDYNAKIVSADKLFANQEYEQAFDLYINALNLKPEEEYPAKQIRNINQLLATGSIDIQCEIHENGMALADASIEVIENGKSEVITVSSSGKHNLKLKLNSKYLLKFKKEGYVHKIFDIDTQLPDDEEINTVFTTILSVELFPLCEMIDLSLFDKPLISISYRSNSKEFTYDYSTAVNINKRTEQLKQECAQANAEKRKLKEYEALLAEGEGFMKSEDYSSALLSYQSASRLYTTKEFPREQIIIINGLLRQNNEYDQLIANGDSKFAQGKLNDALFDYYKAKNLKPRATYPPEKIAEIDGILAAQNAEGKKYQMQLQKADSLFDAKLWAEAIVEYDKAIVLKGNEPYPKDRLQLARQYLSTQNELNASYQIAIKKADAYFENQSFSEARKAYLEANRVKPDEAYPLYKIEDINTIVEQKGIRETNDRYRELVASADKLFAEKAYPISLSQYKLAAALKPNEVYPPQQIAKINLILGAVIDQDNKYKSYIKTADSAFFLDEYSFARPVYVKANTLKPKEEYPIAQINKIDELLAGLNDLEKNYKSAIERADANFKEIQYALARANYKLALTYKPTEVYPKQKIDEIDLLLANLNSLEAAYQKAIAEGDRNFDAKNYVLSLTAYKEALTIKANEEYPKSRITEIESILANLNSLEAAYQKAIAEGDRNFDAKNYVLSLTAYKEALKIKANEVYPKSRITEIESILANMNSMEAAYQKAIAEGDRNFDSKNYVLSLTAYKEALKIKANEVYPKDRITEIESILANLNSLEAAYQKAIAEGNRNFDTKNYVLSLTAYKEALKIKANEEYPKSRISEIESILANLNSMEAAYQKAIAEGDRNFDSENYVLSMSAYKEALKIKANEAYPKSRITEIESILTRLAQLDKEYNLVLAKADDFYKKNKYSEALPFYKQAQGLKPLEKYPPDQIYRINSILNEQLSLEKSYAQAIASADKLFSEKKYQEALSPYQKASQIKPYEKYPPDQMAKIRELLGMSTSEYKAFIKQGDDAYRLSNFQDAILAYENALGIFPEEAYPKMMLEKIDAKIRRESVLSLVSTPETLTAGIEKRYTFKPIDYRDRQNNYILIEMKNASDVQMRVFINFGKDAIKNGGYAVNLVQRDGYTKYFVLIDKQLRWKSEDNNWIALIPEGGDLDVKVIQISREEKTN